MKPIPGKKYLITTDNWFFGPDGESYKAAFGTVHEVLNDEQTLGIKTNARSANWYVHIGSRYIAGCQIHYVLQCETVNFDPPQREVEHAGAVAVLRAGHTRIFDADAA